MSTQMLVCMKRQDIALLIYGISLSMVIRYYFGAYAVFILTSVLFFIYILYDRMALIFKGP